MQLNEILLPTYIINLPEREERLSHIKTQFSERNEFETTIVEACRHTTGAIGLWKSIIKVIKLAIENEDDVIVICEDDHEFTKEYSKEFLIKNIIEAGEQGADILSGGAGSFGQAMPITAERYWINPIFSTQFIVIYSKFFKKILDYKFKKTDTADGVFSLLTSHKMLLFPYISIQRDFGYSDITQIHNEIPGLVSNMFNESQNFLRNIKAAYLRQ
ncbi:glycosyl transferase [Pedobacter sp. HDW13]|nr:glycosyl transferase [Pedobacter sp. HDW13]